jgi:hypothetical protein
MTDIDEHKIIHIACEELKMVVSTTHEEICKVMDNFKEMDRDKLMETYLKTGYIIGTCAKNRMSKRRLLKLQKTDPKRYELIKCDIILFYCARYYLLEQTIPICDPFVLEEIQDINTVQNNQEEQDSSESEDDCDSGYTSCP